MARVDRDILRKIVNNNFTFSDFNKYLNTNYNANVYCPFHEHSYRGKGNAKLYYNEQEGIWFLHCFVKCGSLTTFDYVERIIVNRNREYDSVYDFLLDKLGKAEFLSQYKGLRDNIVPMKESEQREKNNYITNIYNETDDVVEFIEKLYTVDGEEDGRE